MSCERTRERLMELEVSAFDGVEHLQTCASCRAFADELRQADGAMAAHVEAFAARGSLEQEWIQAKGTARRPSRAWYSGAGFVIVALAAAALLMFRPPSTPPPTAAPTPVVADPVAAPPVVAPPVVAPPAAAPPAAAPPVVPAPAPALAPAPLPVPRPAPPRTARPSVPPATVARPSAPAATEPPPVATPSVDPSPAPPPTVAIGRSPLVVRIDADLAGIRSADLTCGSDRSKATRSGDLLRFDAVPDGACQIVFRGPEGVSAVVSGGNWRLTRIDGAIVLVRD